MRLQTLGRREDRTQQLTTTGFPLFGNKTFFPQKLVSVEVGHPPFGCDPVKDLTMMDLP